MSIDYLGALQGIEEDVEKLFKNAEADSKKCLNRIGTAVAHETTKDAEQIRSDNDYYWSKGEKKQNVHIADDVVYKVKKSRKTNQNYVSISGGKKTWPKWILANDGHVAQNGRFIPGNHFVEQSVKNSENAVDQIVNEYVGGIVNG